ncbi:MAG: hypothetical protein OES25_00705 [Acidobacteriota bacterium]|nr:hypothetical protein [Acidobacteriota bacterium]
MNAIKGSSWRRLVIGGVLLLAGILVPGIHAAPVLTSITIDGNMSDWSSVLANPSQVSLDGPAGTNPDLDAPIQSTGRDLSAFAWTYDSSYFYMYVRRVGSSKNRQEFWFYLDLNGDQLMQSGEKVFHVSWWGKNRKTVSEIHNYVAVAGAGDPLVGGGGMADGYTMPGSITLVSSIETLYGGTSSGMEMESRVSWSTLGVPAPMPFYFHVSTSNGANIPTQIDDNLGGPGGTIGSTFTPGVMFTPDRSTTVTSGGQVVVAHVLTNTGSGTDTFELTDADVGDFSPSLIDYFNDLDGDQVLDVGEPALTDTDGDGVVDSGPLAASSTINLLVRVTVPGGLGDGDTSTTTLTATSNLTPGTTDNVDITLLVATPQVTLVKSVNLATAAPGDALTYTLDFVSNGTTTAYNVAIVDSVPPECQFETGTAMGTGTLIEFSHDGGTTFDAVDNAPVTHVRWTVAAPLAPGDTGSVSYQARVQ